MGAEFDHLHSLNEQCGVRTMKENETMRRLILGKQFLPYQNMHALELKDISHPPSNRPHACNIALKPGAKCPYNWGSAAKIGIGSCCSMLVVGWGEYHSNYAKDGTAWCFYA